MGSFTKWPLALALMMWRMLVSHTWFRVPGPPAIQCAALKSWEWAWGRGYVCTLCIISLTRISGRRVHSHPTLTQEGRPCRQSCAKSIDVDCIALFVLCRSPCCSCCRVHCWSRRWANADSSLCSQWEVPPLGWTSLLGPGCGLSGIYWWVGVINTMLVKL